MTETAIPTTLDGRTEHGIWSDQAGGFVDSAIYTESDARSILDSLIAQGEDAEDLQVVAFCQEHRDDEQQANCCETCNAEEDEDTDEDDES